MRNLTILVLSLIAAHANAQDVSENTSDSPYLAEPIIAEPSYERLDGFEDFVEVTTDAEQYRKDELRAGQRKVAVDKPRYKKYPALTYTSQAVAGVFGAGVLGIVGASLGGMINEGDDLYTLGGFHGPIIGGAFGATMGAYAGVALTAYLFEKDPTWGWTALGTLTGTLVGSGIALGLIEGLGDSDLVVGSAIAVVLLGSVGGGMFFNEQAQPRITAAQRAKLSMFEESRIKGPALPQVTWALPALSLNF